MIYFAVLSLAMVTGAMAVGALIRARGEFRVSRLGGDAASARDLAASGISYAIGVMNADRAWRSTKPATWFSDSRVGDGRLTLSATDSSGNVGTAELDPVIVTATATCGEITKSMRVTLLPTRIAATGLEAAVSCGGTMTITASTINSGRSAPIYSAGNATAVASIINVPVESARVASGGSFRSGSSSAVTAKTLPTRNVPASYAGIATRISTSSIPSLLGTFSISRVLLSPSSNPFGTALNPRGVYSIDLAGANLNISDCRIVGTLVILNAGSVTVSGSVSMEPAESSRPVLVIQGTTTMSLSSSTLNETGVPLLSPTMNFNPVGTPFPFTGSSTDNDTADTYVSGIHGLVYVEGNLGIKGNTRVHQLMASKDVSIEGTLTVNPDATIIASPPPGFYWLDHAPMDGSYTLVP
ncbi:MAG: hypothetical protein K2X32_03085 [Phycisphaerales bacterium]|nr:hypothetical protein [Phycisphaerales bacterium]